MTHCESTRKDMKKRGAKNGANAKKSHKTADPSKTTDVMKMTLFDAPVVPRSQTRERRTGRQLSGKRLPVLKKITKVAKPMVRRSLDPSDSSNDSGLGFDNHMESPSNNDSVHWIEDRLQPKRQKLDVKLESNDINENYCFPESTNIYRDYNTLIRTAPSASLTSLTVSNTQSNTSRKAIPRCIPLLNKSLPSSPITLTTQLQSISRYSDISLSIICQPEQQHRARYQTEGSRGAVKDRSGHGFPVVQLVGYNKPTTLQVFIGTDVGKVMPHMFYQACKVSGKNSTPCSEKKIDGTIVIELQLDPNKEMTATCDCVGILKERNVDVEHRFPDQLASRSKKKSTRCRMVFRTTIVHDDGFQETLQVCSQAIVCTQPPGVPEISKKSLTTCPVTGGLELFIIGKNFLKDTMVYFQCGDESHNAWEKGVAPDKEFLQQTHLVCVVPPYVNRDITESVNVRLYVVSSGKASEAHQFVYTPVNGSVQSVNSEPVQPQTAPFLAKMWTSMTKHEQDVGMMPPPGTNLVPVSQRRSSLNMLTTGDVHSPPMRTLKQELMDENSQNSILDPSELTQHRYRHISESSLDVHQGDSNMSMINDNSIDMIRQSSVMHGGLSDNSNLTMDDLRRDELAIMDLRMKLPMSTVEDLVNTKEPSLATLRSFGVTESSTMALTAQTAQSIENYLTNIENKPALTNSFIPKTEGTAFIQQTENIPPSPTQGSSFINRADGIPPRVTSFISQSESTPTRNSIFISQSETVPTQNTTFISQGKTIQPQSTGFISQAESISTQNSAFITQADNIPSQGSAFISQADNIQAQGTSFISQTENIPSQGTTFISQSDNIPSQGATFISQADNIPSQGATFISQADNIPSQATSFISQADNIPPQGAAFISQSENIPTQNAAFITQTESLSGQNPAFMTQTESIPTTNVSFVTQGESIPSATQVTTFISQAESIPSATQGNFISQTESLAPSVTQGTTFISQTESIPSQNGGFISQAETQNTTFITQAGSVQSQNTTFMTQAESVQTQNTTFMSQAESVQTQNTAFMSQAESVQSQSTAFMSQAESVQSQNSAFMSQAESVQSQNTTFMSQGESIQTQNGNFISQGKSIESQNAAFIAQNDTTPTGAFETRSNGFVAENGNFINGPLLSKQIDTTVPQQNPILPTGISAEKLDALVNCAMETHITTQKNTDVLMTAQDVILNNPLAPIITTAMDPNQISPGAISVGSSISPEIILNSQISPSLMCRNAEQDKPIFPGVEASISIRVTDPEKAILLNAAADLLETQKKINDMQSSLPERNNRMINDILSTPTTVGNTFFNTNLQKISGDKEISDKKSEERMIPPSFATMSENDLINIINPSCFDQV